MENHFYEPSSTIPTTSSPQILQDGKRESDSSPVQHRRKWSMHRSRSTPNVRSLASSESAAMSAADKRRNKLGYHRTAVACGHCRKRKIRCVMAIDDPGSRCQNCIRLKKECHFFPVDHPPSFTKRTRSGSKVENTSTDAETSGSPSSPGVGGSTMDRFEDLNSAPLESLSLSQEGRYFSGAPIMTPNDKEFIPGVAHPVSPDYGANTSWHSTPYLNQSPRQIDSSQFEHSWTGTTPSYSQSYARMTMGPPSATFPPPEHMQDYVTQHDWSQTYPQMRSMSVDGPADHQNYHGFPTDPHPGLRRSMTYSSETAFAAQNHHPFPTPPGSQTQSVSGTLSFDEPGASHMLPHSFPPMWNVLPGQPAPLTSSGPIPSAQAWFTPSPGLADVREEEFSHPQHPP